MVANVFGRWQSSVSIVPGDGYLGIVHGEEGISRVGPNSLEVDPGKVEGKVCELYAGYAAAIRFAPASKDSTKAGASSDFGVADEMLEWVGLATDAHRERLSEKTERLVADRWAEIDRLARELIVKKTLPGEEADVILEVARGEATEAELTRFRMLFANSQTPTKTGDPR